MEKSFLRKKAFLWLSVIGIIAVVVGLAACAPATTTQTTTAKSTKTPQADSYGVIGADAWQDVYPNEYATFEQNLENSPEGKINYLEAYPAITTLYKGNAFSKGYEEPAGHNYSLESVTGTPRVNENTLANCLTCKTPQFTVLVNQNGDTEYAQNFLSTAGNYTENISCYNCHENNPEQLSVPNKFFVAAMGDDFKNLPDSALTCGQCHNEYYFNPETKATTNPYTSKASMLPDAILAYYNDLGFSDWKYPVTETPMIKVQHPEFETLYNGQIQSHMVGLGYSCSDCHMGKTTADDGTVYSSHYWVSPLENEELLRTDCYRCHDDLASEVAAWQERSESRVQSISYKIADLADRMTAQVNDGSLSGDKLAQLQSYHRAAQFYWDFIFVENSEGAHNPTFSDTYLDKAEAAADAGLAML